MYEHYFRASSVNPNFDILKFLKLDPPSVQETTLNKVNILRFLKKYLCGTPLKLCASYKPFVMRNGCFFLMEAIFIKEMVKNINNSNDN